MLVSYGAVSAVASVVVGHVSATHIRRVYVVISGATFNAGLLLVLAWWTPASDDPAMFYVVAGCLGLCDAIWQTQTNSEYSLLVMFFWPLCVWPSALSNVYLTEGSLIFYIYVYNVYE